MRIVVAAPHAARLERPAATPAGHAGRGRASAPCTRRAGCGNAAHDLRRNWAGNWEGSVGGAARRRGGAPLDSCCRGEGQEKGGARSAIARLRSHTTWH